jgi:PHD/YefM family antitoxin component YafN of YafNO toxin-antitoxin module
MSSVRFLVNDQGRKEGVLIDIKLYEKILDELEELESIRAYDKAKASGDEMLPFEKAVKEIEREREQK